MRRGVGAIGAAAGETPGVTDKASIVRKPYAPQPPHRGKREPTLHPTGGGASCTIDHGGGGRGGGGRGARDHICDGTVKEYYYYY